MPSGKLRTTDQEVNVGGSKKKKNKESADIKKKKGEIKDLNKNIEESSEIVTDLAAELEKNRSE